MTLKEELHRLVDELPEERWQEARQFLQELHAAAGNVDDEALTAEDWDAIRKGEEAIQRGDYITLDELKRKYNL